MSEQPPQPPRRPASLLSRVLRSGGFRAVVAVAIIYLLVRYNRLDWAGLSMLHRTWPWLAVAFALMLPPFAIVSYRLRLILLSQRIEVSMAEAVRWTMIGSLFDLVMPSSNGGDVVKAGYIVSHTGAGSRVRAVTAVLIDRVLGLVGLFLLAGIVSGLNWRVVAALPGGPALLLASLGATALVLLGFRVLGARRIYRNPWLNARLASGNWGRRIREFVGAFNELRERPAFLMAALALSVCNHAFWCVALICISRAVDYQVSWVEGFAAFPLAIFGNIFGFAGGFGVGTAAFDLILSRLLGVGNGALIGLLFQTLSGISKLAGLPFYLSRNGFGDSRAATLTK